MEIHKSENAINLRQTYHDSTAQEIFVNIPSEDEQVSLSLIMPSIELEDSIFNFFISDIKVKIEDEREEPQDLFKLNQDSLWRHRSVKMEDAEQELKLIDEYIEEKLKKEEINCEFYSRDLSKNCEDLGHNSRDSSFNDPYQKLYSTHKENETKKMPSKLYPLRSRCNLKIIGERNVSHEPESIPHAFTYNEKNSNSLIKQEDASSSSEFEVKYFGDCCSVPRMKLCNDSESYEDLSRKQKLPVRVFIDSPKVVEKFSKSKTLNIYKQSKKACIILSSPSEESSARTEKTQTNKRANVANSCIPRKTAISSVKRHVHRAHCNRHCSRRCKQHKFNAQNCPKLRRSKRIKNKYRKLKFSFFNGKFSSGNEQKKVSTSKNVNRVEVLKKNVYIRNLSVNGLYGCSACKYESFKKTLIVQHIRRHTGYKPYKCDACSYASVEKSHLNRHQKVHTSYRPHKCLLCPYEAIQKFSLKLHLKKKHSMQII